MNKIQEEHAKFQYDEISVKEASNHESVTLKHMRQLMEFSAKKGYVAIIGSNGVYFTNNSGKYFSTETLINKYIKQL